MYPSLYFHFPFCETKCHYCDFYSIGREKTKGTDANIFESALIKEIEIRGQEGAFPKELKTIFLGGGTPSMTPPDSMARIFETLFQFTSITSETEWTMEANPSSILPENFREYRRLGINRVSIGVQSLRSEKLIELGRVHNEEEAYRALDTIFSSGFTRASTDLLCGVPGQTLEDLEHHIEKLTSYPITHLSIYLLTLHPTHRMFKDLPDEETQLEHLLFIDERMKKKGFDHYEISNFARITDPNDPTLHRAKHNMVYWTHGSYLGFGPSAHSYNEAEGLRFKNKSSLHSWAETLLKDKQIPIDFKDPLDSNQRELEKWLLAIRLSDGFPRSWAESEKQKPYVERLLSEGYLEPHPSQGGYLRATAKGFAMSDAIIRVLCKLPPQ